MLAKGAAVLRASASEESSESSDFSIVLMYKSQYYLHILFDFFPA